MCLLFLNDSCWSSFQILLSYSPIRRKKRDLNVYELGANCTLVSTTRDFESTLLISKDVYTDENSHERKSFVSRFKISLS